MSESTRSVERPPHSKGPDDFTTGGGSVDVSLQLAVRWPASRQAKIAKIGWWAKVVTPLIIAACWLLRR